MRLSLQSSRGNTVWKVRQRIRSEILSNLLRVSTGLSIVLSISVVNIAGPEAQVQDQVRSATLQLKADRGTDGIQIQYLSDAWRVHKSFCFALRGRKVDQGENPELTEYFPKYYSSYVKVTQLSQQSPSAEIGT